MAYAQLSVYAPISIAKAEKRADGFIHAPYFFRTSTLFEPMTPTARHTLERVRQAHNNNQWVRTVGSFRAFAYSCLTHDYLISGQRYSVEYGDVGNDNDRQPIGLLDRKPWDAPLLLLTVESINGPTVTELLPRCGATLANVHRAMAALAACKAKIQHPGDSATIAHGEKLLFEAWQRLMLPLSPMFLI